MLGVLVALLYTVFTVAFREGPEEAFAAPPKPKTAHDGGVEEAGPDATAAAPSAAAGPSDGGKSDGGNEILDMAIAPDGGVPYHVDAGAYRSPFALPAGTTTETARAKVAFLLNSVDDYDVKTGTFEADFFISFTSRLPMPDLSLSFANGKIDSKEVLADKPTFKFYRMTGKFKSPPNLRKYPFDSQELRIVVEDDVHGIDQLRLQVDKERTQLARGFRALGWQVSYVEGRSMSQSYPDRFEGDDLYYSRYTFVLGLDRFATSAAFKVYVPGFVIVLIALLGMWVPPNEMEVRSNAGAPMLAGAVLFHFALMQELPATAYLTRADKLMLGVYISLALGMLSTWCMFLVEEAKMEKVFRIARIVVPILTAITMALAVLF